MTSMSAGDFGVLLHLNILYLTDFQRTVSSCQADKLRINNIDNGQLILQSAFTSESAFSPRRLHVYSFFIHAEKYFTCHKLFL